MIKRLCVLFLLYFSIQAAKAQENNLLINSAEFINNGIKLHDAKKYKDAIEVYSKISRADTNYVWALYEMALSYTADSQYNRAIKYCEEALSMTTEREREPELYTQYGSLLDETGEQEKSLEIFNAAISKYPAYASLYL